ncbi:hypothetical protein C8R44DRAFT_991403 [Mycena epipterygia]|nr:hypothetical protein C8R44DRAFT_991403 [Mycena epipterygia]
MATRQTLTVEVHSFESHPEQWCSWPPEVWSLYQTYNIPLPSWCATGPYPLSSTKIAPLLSELARLHTPYDDSHIVAHERLSDVFHASLSTVADIRSLITNYGPSRSVVPLVLGLVRVLTHLCAKESILIPDTPFVRPRRPVPDGGFDGIATILACHVVAGLEDNRYFMGLVQDGRESSPSVSGAESTHSSASTSSLHLPLEAHVLPGHGRQLFAALPFFCIADSDNIVDLMSSVACQRHVWGIPEPVIGFVLSDTGVIGKLVLSWVDVVTHVVHIVGPVDDANFRNTAPGIFDFTCPVSILQFSCFILSLSSHVAILSEHNIPSCESTVLDWRSDTVEITPESLGASGDRVGQWMRDVEKSFGKSSLDLPSTPPPSPPTRMSVEMEKSAGLFEGQETEEQSVYLSARSQQSNSESSLQGLDKTERADALFWLSDRGIYLGGLIPFIVTEGEAGDEFRAFNRNLLSYEGMCGFLWPTSWDPKSCPVDAALLPLRDLLFQQAKEQRPGNAVLRHEHRQFLEENMAALLYASAGAFTLQMRRLGIQVNGAEGRHDWNALLYRFYARKDEDTSPYVVLEGYIDLPKNALADEITSESFVEDHQNQVTRNAVLCAHAYTAAKRRKLNPEITQQALNASTEAYSFAKKFSSMLAQPAELKKLVEERSGREPRGGKCDALLQIIEDGSLLPHFVAQHKKGSDDGGRALNQGRMYLSSVIAFYSALGIEDRAFYCLVTSGMLGMILMAWKSSRYGMYLIERNTRSFDISIPVQAYHFASFLLRLRDEQETLKQCVRERVKAGLDLAKLRRWTKSSQLGEALQDPDAELDTRRT